MIEKESVFEKIVSSCRKNLLLFSLLVLSFSAIMLPLLYRKLYGLTLFFGSQFYENQLLFRTVQEQLIFSDLLNVISSYPFFHAMITSTFQLLFSIEILLIGTFLLSTVLGFWALKTKDITDGRLLFLFLFILFSPSVLFSFHSFDALLFVLPVLLSFYLSLHYKKNALAFFFGILASLLSFESAVLSLVLFIYITRKNAEKLLSGFFYVIWTILAVTHFFTNMDQFEVTKTFFETGNLGGYFIFIAILGAVGFLLSWRKREKLFHVSGLIIIALSFFQEGFIAFATILLANYASIAIEKLFAVDWLESQLKVLTLLLVYALAIGGFIFYVQAVVTVDPNQEQTSFYSELSENLQVAQTVETKILTLPRQQPYVSYFTNATSVVVNDTQFYLQTDLANALSFLSAESVDYILVDAQMKDGEIWTLQDSGLLLFLEGSEVFKPVFKTEVATIYWVDYGVARRLSIIDN